METLDIEQAATFLKMNAEVLRRKAKAGEVPGRKTGKRWVFVAEHLAEFISSGYNPQRRELQAIDGGKPTEAKQCRSINAAKAKSGGYNSPTKTETEYNKLLGLK